MSRLSYFKPEWIKELRVVDNSNPKNPDVIYNNGHFLHQITFFLGPVNFYWKEGDKSYCKEMNTGDSNYITPFYSHSFANRDENKDAIIIAVTFGGEVRKNQKELYWLGKNRIQKFIDLGKEKQKQKFTPVSIKRAKAYIDSGVDGIMIHSKSKSKSENEILSFCNEYKKFQKRVPLIVVPSTYNHITEDELEFMGVNIVIYANHLLRSAYPSMVTTAKSILENKRSYEANDKCLPIKQVLKLIPND